MDVVIGNFASRSQLATRLTFTFITLFCLSFTFIEKGLALSQPPGADTQSIDVNGLNPYFGRDFYQRIHNGEKDQTLKADLLEILKSAHLKHGGDFDETSAKCAAGQKDCVVEMRLTYPKARDFLLGVLFLTGTEGSYGVKEVYCQRNYLHDDFGSGPYPAPNQSPTEKVINIEHTWPQSRFSNKYDKMMQKTDMHHLFPADSKMNALRGNFKFADVDNPDQQLPCPISKLGSIKGSGETYFEPPQNHKGHVARALFYFSVRYEIAIDPEEEAALRKWHKAEPVDADEKSQNEAIYGVQGDRNPFIDMPELVDSIHDF